jgi:cytochrome P450
MRDTEKDFFRDDELVSDPYPYLAALRNKCPVRREPHHDVVMVTGYDEALAVLGDATTFSSCMSVTGPFPGFPVPLEGDDVSELIASHRDAIPMSDQIITLDPPTHTDHRALLMGLITPKRLKENEAFMWELTDRVLDSFLTGGRGEFIGEFAAPFSLLVIADLLGVPEEDRDEFAAVLGRSDAASAAPATTPCGTARWSTCTSGSPAISKIAAASRARTCSPAWPPRHFRTARRRRSSTSCAWPPTSFQPGRRQRCACWAPR